MVQHLILQSQQPESGFYLHEYEQLVAVLQKCISAKKKVLLIGVTFALIDFAKQNSLSLGNTIIMETGGMKGRGVELTRNELHQLLSTKLGVQNIHSEYGMTELLSQAYSAGKGLYTAPPWLKPLVRSEDDPFLVSEKGKGLLNVIDLANVYSCAFLATDDIATIHANGQFEILGRMDNTDVRGCSMLTA
jgi:hypothetical protein